MAASGKLKARKLAIGAAKVVLTAVILYFLYAQIDRHWDQIKHHDWHLNWGWLVVSILGGLSTFLLISSAWQRLIAAFGHRIPLRKCFRIFYLADLGRYIPGKVWALLGVLYLAKQEGVEPERATASFVVHQLFCIPASFLVFALAILIDPDLFATVSDLLGSASVWGLAVLLVLAAASLVLWPKLLLPLVNRLLKWAGRPAITFQMDKKVALQLLGHYFLGWFGYGVAFFLFLKAVVPASDISFLTAAGIYNAAYQIGYVSLFAPGGFGPRELVLGYLLEPYVGPLAAAIAILARLWVIVIEITAALIALTIKK